MANAILGFLKEIGLQIVVKNDSVGIQIGGNQKPLVEELPETDDSDLMNDDTIPGRVIDIPRTQERK